MRFIEDIIDIREWGRGEKEEIDKNAISYMDIRDRHHHQSDKKESAPPSKRQKNN